MNLGKTRVIAATNRDLLECVKEGTFREDLYYRVNIAQVQVPPLRERGADILDLSDIFLGDICRRSKRKISLSEAARKALLQYEFPGNIRELRNLLERAVIFSQGKCISPQDLGLAPVEAGSEGLISESSLPVESMSSTLELPNNLNLQDHEKHLLEEAIQQTEGNHSQAARLLGITPQALYRKLDKYGLRQR